MNIELNENGNAIVDGKEYEVHGFDYAGLEAITIPDLDLISYNEGESWNLMAWNRKIPSQIGTKSAAAPVPKSQLFKSLKIVCYNLANHSFFPRNSWAVNYVFFKLH